MTLTLSFWTQKRIGGVIVPVACFISAFTSIIFALCSVAENFYFSLFHRQVVQLGWISKHMLTSKFDTIFQFLDKIETA